MALVQSSHIFSIILLSISIDTTHIYSFVHTRRSHQNTIHNPNCNFYFIFFIFFVITILQLLLFPWVINFARSRHNTSHKCEFIFLVYRRRHKNEKENRRRKKTNGYWRREAAADISFLKTSKVLDWRDNYWIFLPTKCTTFDWIFLSILVHRVHVVCHLYIVVHDNENQKETSKV